VERDEDILHSRRLPISAFKETIFKETTGIIYPSLYLVKCLEYDAYRGLRLGVQEHNILLLFLSRLPNAIWCTGGYRHGRTNWPQA